MVVCHELTQAGPERRTCQCRGCDGDDGAGGDGVGGWVCVAQGPGREAVLGLGRWVRGQG